MAITFGRTAHPNPGKQGRQRMTVSKQKLQSRRNANKAVPHRAPLYLALAAALSVLSVPALAADQCEIGDTDLACGNGAVATGVSTTAVGAFSTAQGSRASAFGANSQARGNDATAVGAGSTAIGVDTTAIGVGAAAVSRNAVALGADSVADRANTVSVGYEGGERQITNV